MACRNERRARLAYLASRPVEAGRRYGGVWRGIGERPASALRATPARSNVTSVGLPSNTASAAPQTVAPSRGAIFPIAPADDLLDLS